MGCRAIKSGRMHERRLVNFLDSIKDKAAAIYLLGDMFDFWYEYKTVVPRGYTRFLGKISELTDRGVEVHFFIGNHDLWCNGYLAEECGVIMHYEPLTVELHGKEFYLAHGDGLGDPDVKFKLLRRMFHCRALQKLFSNIHPRWSIVWGLNWARHSRLIHEETGEPVYKGEAEEHLVAYSKEYLRSHPTINYFIYGHRHLLLDLTLGSTSRLLIIGDWLHHFSYAVFDGVNLYLEEYVEGESHI